MNLTVTEKRRIAADTLRIRLAAPDASALPPFKPGAHIELTFAGLNRRYSLTSSPHAPDHYEICVLRTEPSRGGSAYLHDRLHVGETLGAQGPFNAFPLQPEAAHSVFIAGGIGITPFFSMMEALERSSASFELHYAARSPDRFLPLPAYTRRTHRYPDPDGKPRLEVEALLAPLSADVDLYVCGPRGLIEAVRAEARGSGWPEERIHFESFGAGRRPGDTPVTVHLALTELTIEVPTDRTILDALLEHGVWAPYECQRGECASCFTEVLSGQPDHRDLCLTDDQRRRGMCTCISWSQTPEVTLDL